MATIGEQLREARKRKGLTQEALAAALHMSRQGISHWEQGRTTPDAEMLLKLSAVLEYNFEAQQPLSPEPLPAAEPVPDAYTPEAVQPPKADEQPLPQEKALPAASDVPAARSRHTKWWLAAAAALLGLSLLLMILLPKLPPRDPKVSLSFAEGEIRMEYVPSSFTSSGYGWLFTLAIHNESNTPLKPEKVSTLYYTNERIAEKRFMTYSDMRPWMDNDLLYKTDTPLHLYFGTSDLSNTSVECILQATDPDGNMHIYSITAPLLPAES